MFIKENGFVILFKWFSPLPSYPALIQGLQGHGVLLSFLKLSIYFTCENDGVQKDEGLFPIQPKYIKPESVNQGKLLRNLT